MKKKHPLIHPWNQKQTHLSKLACNVEISLKRRVCCFPAASALHTAAAARVNK